MLCFSDFHYLLYLCVNFNEMSIGECNFHFNLIAYKTFQLKNAPDFEHVCYVGKAENKLNQQSDVTQQIKDGCRDL